MELEATFTEGVEAIRTPEGIRNGEFCIQVNDNGFSPTFGANAIHTI